MKIVFGITGSAGSGKSFISKLIKNYIENTYIIDVDKIGHEVLKKNEVKIKLVNHFGKDILDNNKNINRKRLSILAFNNSENIIILNSITHPLIFNKTKDILKNFLNKYNLILIDAALLHQIHLNQLCNKVLLVTASKEVRLKRLIEKRNISHEKALNIIDIQNTLYDNIDFDIHVDTSNFNKQNEIDFINMIKNYLLEIN